MDSDPAVGNGDIETKDSGDVKAVKVKVHKPKVHLSPLLYIYIYTYIHIYLCLYQS